MKKFILVGLAIFLAGCSSYLDDPSKIIKDPHYSSYQDQRDQLESDYLRKKITYAEYIERRNALDEHYAGEVLERNRRVAPSQF